MFYVLGSWTLSSYEGVRGFAILWGRLFRSLISERPNGREYLKQMNFVAVESVVIICFCVSFAAMVTILESSFHMKIVVQNDAMVPGFASLLILRELAVVVTALLLTSRVGAGMAAEVATMKVTEQIDALKLLGLDPVQYLVVPRFLACLVSGVILTIFANMVCLFGAMWVSQWHLGFTPEAFVSTAASFVQFKDFYFSMIKGAVFGSIIPVVACFYGFRCKGGAEGVGTATTKAVVACSVLIIFSDFVLTALFSFFY